eukprot:gene479-biopygen7739
MLQGTAKKPLNPCEDKQKTRSPRHGTDRFGQVSSAGEIYHTLPADHLRHISVPHTRRAAAVAVRELIDEDEPGLDHTLERRLGREAAEDGSGVVEALAWVLRLLGEGRCLVVRFELERVAL